MIQTSIYAIIGIIYPSNQLNVIGKLEMAGGIGLTAGPTIGYLLYIIGNFSIVFYVLGVLFFVSMFVPYLGITREADRREEHG